MARLTNNKKVSEMSMYELAHNSCYAKDGKARYREYETDIDARELAIKLLEKYADIPNEFTCDDDFDEFIMDALQYGTDDMLGLIAVFYRNLWAMADLRERLKEYEDLEEQGKLLKLPCAVGDTVYKIIRSKQGIEKVEGVWIDWIFEHEEYFGETVFLSKNEAEAVLKELSVSAG